MSPIWSIFLGILSGVLTAAVLYLLRVNYEKILLPWIKKHSYDGIELEGSWFVQLEPLHQNRTIKVELDQYGSSLTGLAMHVTKTEEVKGDKIRAYKLKGRIHDRFVSLTGELTDPKRLGALHYLLELSDDGQVMHGNVMAYSTFENKIVVHGCTLTRAEAIESLNTQTPKQSQSSNAEQLSPLATG